MWRTVLFLCFIASVLGRCLSSSASVWDGFLLGVGITLLLKTSMLTALRTLAGMSTTVAASVLKQSASQKDSNVYGTTHALLNLRCNTTWLNFGYWIDSGRRIHSFSKACRALALRVSEACSFQAGVTVLDVGYGCGDQDILWWKRYAPKEIIGVTAEKVQHAIATAKVKELQLHSHIRLYIGDACNLSAVDELETSLNNKHKLTVDRVVALDCAYHFSNRRSFFQQSYDRLVTGGKIAVTDILMATPHHEWSFLSRLLIAAMCRAAHIPPENMIDSTAYRAMLESVGFKEVQVEYMEEQVWGGFVAFVDAHYNTFGAVVMDSSWLKYRLFQWLLQHILSHSLCHYALISAVK